VNPPVVVASVVVACAFSARVSVDSVIEELEILWIPANQAFSMTIPSLVLRFRELAVETAVWVYLPVLNLVRVHPDVVDWNRFRLYN
jgi:hypothetical protein